MKVNDKIFISLFISSNGKHRYENGTMKEMENLLSIRNSKSGIVKEYLNNDLYLLYNKDSNESSNAIVNKYVDTDNVRGPVILYKDDKSDVNILTCENLKKVFKDLDYFEFIV